VDDIFIHSGQMSVTRRFTEEKQAMNNELMHNEDFIRCSTMIAELLMKYKAMEDKDAGEGGMQEEASCSLLFFAALRNKNFSH
jgi:hypothetical protein